MNLNNQPVLYSDIIFTSGMHRQYAEEDYMPDHILCYIVSGEMRVIEATRQSIYRAGETLLLRRDLLVKCEKRPLSAGNPYQVIFIVLKKDFLQHYALNHDLSKTQGTVESRKNIYPLENKPALQGLFNSLLPYLGTGTVPSQALTSLKLTEAVMCLLEQDERMAGWLFDLAGPGKLDLESFMQCNFMFNVPIGKFAELTGRSLSTFQRDFLKRFGMSATTWLLKRRLEAAHEALMIPDKRPSEVYLEVGFENIAHFSRAFKKTYGYNPSKVKTQCPEMPFDQ